jgi:hypothetical protein
MKQLLRYLLFLAFLAVTIYSVQGVPYNYFTEHEITPLGERPRFYGGDTLMGALRSNDSIYIMQSPVFYDYVITTAPNFYRGIGYNPQFLGPDPIFDAPALQFTNLATWTREQAQAQGRYFESGTYTRARVAFEDHNLRITWGVEGTPYDTTYFNYPLPDSCSIFFNCPVQISGIVNSVIIFGASGDIGLEDNIVYAGTDTTTGIIAEDETAKLVLISENKILVLDTWANGRDNQAQGSDIIINALIVALGDSGYFTFENQNNIWDSYIGPTPDERGKIRLTGSLYQRFRGYVHRANNGGTGYLKNYKYDERLRYWQLPIFVNPAYELIPAVLDFDTIVTTGEEYIDTVQILLDTRALIDIPLHSEGEFATSERLYAFDSTIYLPVRFITYYPEAGEFSEEIPFYIEGNRFTIPVRGVAVIPDDASENFIPHPSSFSLSCYPNPFNPATTIQFDLPVASRVSLNIYNTNGQNVQSLAEQAYSAESHTLSFDGSGLPSGLYFARLQAGNQIRTTKLMLLK